ncbi:hypothetical protein [Microbacterium sp. H6]|uniref:hypothetical protein n=1 Tax=Microbacterium sp. H6 TaxID=421122 RepID=UPI000DE2EF57|nr:hypothetical protein [Microbacterium sp. H6]RBO73043.1 hypothetical protein DSP71_07315 [Microbacterium sp. H6]
MRYRVTAESEDGLSGEGPFWYTADSPDGARQQYIDWALTQHGAAFSGPGLPFGDPFPVITVELVTSP